MLYSNKYAHFKYLTEKEYDAGIALTGVQVKQIRAGKMNLKECNLKFQGGELWVFNSGLNPDKIKLLLNKTELFKIAKYLDEKRHHVFPLGIYTKGRMLKMKIATGTVKTQYQKTQQQKRKEEKISDSRAFREKNFD